MATTEKDFLASHAIRTWERDGVTFYIVPHGHFCGYCRFPARPVREQGYDGILRYAPVHGGITYADEADDGAMTYGFDCAHGGDDNDPRCRDMEWLTAECERLAVAVRVAADYEAAYLLASTEEAKAEAIQRYHDDLSGRGIAFELTDNFGAMIGVLFGDL